MTWDEVEYPEGIDENRVEYFRSLIRNGVKLHAPVVYKTPNGKYQIIDGIQRVEAAKRERCAETISAYVVTLPPSMTATQLRIELNKSTDIRGLN